MQHAHALRAPMVCALALTALSMTITPLAQAAAPKISGTPSTTATVGVAWAFQPSASDADKNTLTFSVANRPGWATFSSATGRVSGTPFAEHAGTWSNIVVSVTDGTTKVSLPAFSLVVKANANKSPTLSGTPPTKATVGTAYSFQPTASDPEGKALKFSVRTSLAWLTISSTTGKLTGTPATKDGGTSGTVQLIATDGVTSRALPTYTIAVAAASGTSNTAPKISGSPATSVSVGSTYSFQPTASDANSDKLTFSIANKPTWASFSTSTGKLTGAPTASNVGTTSNIVISVNDGKAIASLAGFGIVVKSTTTTTGAATLSWTPPTRNTDGSTLSNLAGYKINYGRSTGALTQTAQVSNPGISNYVIENLTSGVWYFSIKSYTTSGTESAASSIASKTVQ